MQKYKSFIAWYYAEGTNGFLVGWMRVVAASAKFFSVGLLLRTLFAPWHRDVSLKNWRGFDPIKSSQRALWNVFSRIIGAIGRSFFICAGILLIAIVFVLGGIALLLYFALPGVVILSLFVLTSKYWSLGIGGFVIVGAFLIIAHQHYKSFFHMPYARMSMLQLSRQPWFHRIWERFGIDPKKDVTPRTLKDLDIFKKLLRAHNVTTEEAEKVISWETERQRKKEQMRKIFSPERLKAMRPISLHWHFGYTVHLDRFVDDWTRHDGTTYADAPFYAHEEDLEMLELILTRPKENNAIIIGTPGVGRRMTVHELARRVRSGRYEGTPLHYMRILRADFAAAIAHAQQSSVDPEFFVHNLFHEAAYAGNVILVVENFENYMGKTRGFSFTTIVEQYASLPTFRMIAITSENAFHGEVEGAESMLRHFDVIHLNEMNEDDAMKVMFMQFYNNSRTVFTYQALREIIIASARYANTGPLPDRALDLATEVRIDWQKNATQSMIYVEDVNRFIHTKTGIPVGTITEKEKQQLLSLEEHFHKRIIGQNEAVNAVADAVRRMRSGMARPNRPAGSFLFLGPTGVGKTEMAKTLADQYFGDEKKIVRLDMSEYQGQHAVAELIGSRIRNEKGQLTTLVQENPYALLLLDELEKANPDVLDLFLQILDEGILHDGFGRKINFTTMIIIATSNAGSKSIIKYIQEHVGGGNDLQKQIIDTVVGDGYFRPEFLNRFDDVIVFHPIDKKQIKSITKLLLINFSKRIEEEQNIQLVFDDGVADIIIDRGFDPAFGARSILRFIDDSIADALSKKFIAGDVKRGEDVFFHVEDLDLS